MNEHLDLVGLLRGELRTTDVVAAGEHLRSCAECRDELVDTAVGHSLLTRSGTALGDPATQSALPPLPPIERRPGASRLTRGLVGVAAAAVVAGLLGAGVAVVRSGDDGPTGPVTPAGQRIEASLTSPALSGEVSGPGDGSVSMVDQDGRTRMSIAVHDLPRPAAGEYLYAWLLDPATDKMLQLGQVDPDDGATFDLDESLLVVLRRQPRGRRRRPRAQRDLAAARVLRPVADHQPGKENIRKRFTTTVASLAASAAKKGTKLTTAQGGTVRVKDKKGNIVLVDKDPDLEDPTVILNGVDINEGNRQIAHAIDRVLLPVNL